MPDFLKTDNAPGHSHIVYVDERTGQGVTSVDDLHTHEVALDPTTGQWVLGFGPDGHSHITLPVSPPGYKTGEEDDKEVIKGVYELFHGWVDADKDNIKDADIAEDFYWGEQWEKSLKDSLISKGRAALTINQIERMVDGLLGEQRQERTDIHYYPMEGGDQRVADILNQITKQILEASYYAREESKVFEDIVITGRGSFNLSVDFKKNIQGDIKVERFPWRDVVYGPHEKEDLSDCEGLIKHKMYSRARLKSMFPEHATEIDGVFVESQMDPRGTTTESIGYASGNYLHPDNKAPILVGGTFPTIDILKKELRLIECWRKHYERVHVLVDLQTNFYYKAEGWSSKDISKLKTIPNISIVERETEKIRVTKIVGNIVLSDEYPADLPDDDFFIIPVYAKRRDGKWKGKVISAIDPQQEVNKRHSQAIDIGNTSAGYGWFYDDVTFPDDKDKRNFEEHISSPGFKLKVGDVNRPPAKIEGGKFPAEIVQLMQMSDQALITVMSADMNPTGANESGAHFLQMKKAKMVTNEYLFDNLAFSKKKLGYLLIKLIQRYYTPQRILRLLNTRAANPQSQQVQIGGQPLGNYSQDEIISLLETTDLANYDVEVSESGYSPTARMATFMLLTQMAQSGAPIPPELMVEFMDIPAELKQRIQESLMQQSQAQATQQEETKKMEIHKTLIAKGIIPPEVQAELQQEQPQQGEPAQPPGNANIQ